MSSGILIAITSAAVLVLLLCAVFASSQKMEKKDTKSNVLKVAQVLLTWVVLVTLAAISGVLQKVDSMPPPMLLLMAVAICFAFAFSFSRIGKMIAESLGYAALIGFHAFRIFAELAIYFGSQEGLTSRYLTWEGGNLDMITGISAVVVAGAVYWKFWKPLVWSWNILGLALLLNVMIRGTLSFPSPVQQLFSEPNNIWVSFFPYIYLPTILVWCALVGHLIIFRKLLNK